jgi:hypothetical protein
LKAKPPKTRPAGWTDGQWQFPKRLEALGVECGWDPAEVQRIAQVSQATVSRWLAYKSKQPDPLAVKRLEIAAKRPPGWLLREPDEGTTAAASGVSTQLALRLVRAGLSNDLLTLSDEELGAVERFRPELRKAILGIVHVYDVPLERAAALADIAVGAEPSMVGHPSGDAPFWFERMARRVPPRKESGSFPSSGSIKIPKR